MGPIQSIRAAVPEDIAAIHAIIQDYADEGIILARTVDEIREHLASFLVAETDEGIIGVIAYYDYGYGLKEIRSLCVRRDVVRSGIGSKLLAAMIGKLRDQGRPRIFVLSYSPGFFRKNGFREVSMDSLPEKIWKDCLTCHHYEDCNETALEFVGPSR